MKNKLLYILFMILILPFFVFLTLSLRKTGQGDTLLNSFYSYDVEKRDGEIDPDGKDFTFEVPKDGNVVMNYSWDVEEPGYITFFWIVDEHDDPVFTVSGFQLSEENIVLNLKKGTYYVSYQLVSDEETFRELCEEYDMFSSEKLLESYIDQIGFDTFDEDADSVFEFSIDITASASAPLWMMAVAVVLGLLEIALLIMLMISDKKDDDTIKGRMNNVAVRYTIFGLVVTLAQVVLAYAVRFLSTDISDELRTNLSFFLIILSVDVIGFPLILMLCRKIPVNRIEKRSIGFGMYLLYALMTIGLIFVGAIIGMVLHLIFSSSQADTSSLADLCITPIRSPEYLP